MHDKKSNVKGIFLLGTIFLVQLCYEIPCTIYHHFQQNLQTLQFKISIDTNEPTIINNAQTSAGKYIGIDYYIKDLMQ